MGYIDEEQIKELATTVNRIAESVAITTAKQFQEQIDQLQAELQQVKEENGRLKERIEELERDLKIEQKKILSKP